MPRSIEDVLEIRYRPNATVLDHRGEWAEALAVHMSLSEWSIVDNRFDVFAPDRTQHIFVSFRNAGMVCLDSPTTNFFPDKVQRFLRRLFEFAEFGDPLHVERLGVRHRVATPFEGTFEELVQRFATRYVGLSAGLKNAFADANLVDIGAPLNFSDNVGNFNTHAGPMLEAEFKAHFKKKEGLPTIGAFTDIDYFVTPSASVSSHEIVAKTRRFAAEAHRRATEICELVIG